MKSTRHLLIAVCLTFVIITFGTAGYVVIEDWDLWDALYMTVITISTVGYREVHPVGAAGRIFTIFLVGFGVMFTLYIAGAIVQFMIEGRIRIILGRRRLDRKIHRLKNHFIVCGYGRIGKVLCRDLMGDSSDVVVIENDSRIVPTLEQGRVPYIIGDASQESVLKEAQIESAKALIAVLGTDVENVFLVLTVRQIRPKMFVMARASASEVKDKLRAAGASKVETPYEIGAARMAQRLLRPTVTSFLDLAFTYSRKDIQMEEIPVRADSPLVGVMLKDSGIRQQFNLIIIAIKKGDGDMIFNPSFEAKINVGDTVIAVGETGNLQQLENVLSP